MNLEQQVCSLELSKRLFELGIKQESLFWWLEGNESLKTDLVFGFFIINENSVMIRDQYSAFTASELLELLPTYINPCWLEVIKGKVILDLKPKYSVRYWDAQILGDSDENLANACAKMLIYLIENNLLEIR